MWWFLGARVITAEVGCVSSRWCVVYDLRVFKGQKSKDRKELLDAVGNTTILGVFGEITRYFDLLS